MTAAPALSLAAAALLCWSAARVSRWAAGRLLELDSMDWGAR